MRGEGSSRGEEVRGCREQPRGRGGSNSKKYEFQILGVRSYFFVFFTKIFLL